MADLSQYPNLDSFRTASDAHLQAIGRIAAIWAELERFAELLIWRLAALEGSIAEAMTTHVGLRSRLEMAAALMHEGLRDVKLQAELKRITDLIQNDLAIRRNKNIHGLWLPNKEGDPDRRLVNAKRGKVRVITIPVSAHEIMQDADAIAAGAWDFILLYLQVEIALQGQRPAPQ